VLPVHCSASQGLAPCSSPCVITHRKCQNRAYHTVICPQVSDGGAQYVLRNSSSPGRMWLATLDAWGAAPPEGNAQQLADYEGLVSLPFDALGDPGWNLQVRPLRLGWCWHSRCALDLTVYTAYRIGN
jgi:hypothetical protein